MTMKRYSTLVASTSDAVEDTLFVEGFFTPFVGYTLRIFRAALTERLEDEG